MKIHASGEDYLETILILHREMSMVRSVDVTKLVEATNGHSLVEAENAICYDIVRGYGLRRSLFRRKGHFYGTKKQKTSVHGNG